MGDVFADEELRNKNKRKLVSPLLVGVLHKVDRRMSIAVVTCHYGGIKPTIGFIKKREDKIRGSVMICVPSSSKTYCVSNYDFFLKNTERDFYG